MNIRMLWNLRYRMGYGVIAFFMLAAVLATCGFAQNHVIAMRNDMMVEGRPFFTDGERYNSFYLSGSPLGKYDMDSESRMSAEIGYRHFGMGSESRNSLCGPTLRMGEPGRAFFEAFYGYDLLSGKTTSNNIANTAKLPLNRFGLIAATRAPSGSFRASFLIDGYLGTQRWEVGDSTRALGLFDNIRFDIGSEVHPLARIGFFISGTLRVDTLRIPGGGHRDYSAQTNLPEIGANIDFGGDYIPVRSNLSFSYASSRFVYVSPTTTEDAIINDSLKLLWLAQGDIPISGEYIVNPGLLFGISSNSGKWHVPDYENNFPHTIGDERGNGYNYSLSGVYFGIGAGFKAYKYALLHTEYSFASMSLECGNQFSPEVKSRMLHYSSFGISTPIHEYLDIPFNISPRIAYFISGSSGIIEPVHSSLDPLNVVSGRSYGYLYRPYAFLTGFARTSGFTFGVDGVGGGGG